MRVHGVRVHLRRRGRVHGQCPHGPFLVCSSLARRRVDGRADLCRHGRHGDGRRRAPALSEVILGPAGAVAEPRRSRLPVASPLYSAGFVHPRAAHRHGRPRRGGLSSTGRALDCGSRGYGFEPRRPPQHPALSRRAGRACPGCRPRRPGAHPRRLPAGRSPGLVRPALRWPPWPRAWPTFRPSAHR